MTDFGTLVRGIDCSHWNGAVDWTQLVDDGVQFAYVKATQGNGVDPQFEANWNGAEGAGLIVMPYPFLTAEDTDATVEHFKSVVGETVPAVLDWETQGVSNSVVETWISGLDRIPLAYYGLYPPDDLTPLIANCPRILPEYAPTPRLPAWDGSSTPDWTKEWLIWQSSDRTTFQGETANFDLDLLAIPLAKFKSWYLTGIWS